MSKVGGGRGRKTKKKLPAWAMQKAGTVAIPEGKKKLGSKPKFLKDTGTVLKKRKKVAAKKVGRKIEGRKTSAVLSGNAADMIPNSMLDIKHRGKIADILGRK